MFTIVLAHEMHYKTSDNEDMAKCCVPPEDLVEGPSLGGMLLDWSRHPDVNLGRAPIDVAAIGLHGDAVQYTSTMRAGGAKSILGVSYNYIIGPKHQRARRFLICCVQKSKMCDCGCEGWHALDEILKVFAWSMPCLARGESPRCRHDDSAWPGKDRLDRLRSGTVWPRAALMQVRGDWEWFYWALRFRHVGVIYVASFARQLRLGRSLTGTSLLTRHTEPHL